MVSLVFWNKLPPHLQALITDTWLETALESRIYAAQRQASARATLIEHGVQAWRADAADLEADRRRMTAALAEQAGLIGVEPALLAEVTRYLDTELEGQANETLE